MNSNELLLTAPLVSDKGITCWAIYPLDEIACPAVAIAATAQRRVFS
jgi:hypothetical protein